ncbi:ATP12-domain-containing protein, partial [Neoconidiobolus thromboides FSU 785]
EKLKQRFWKEVQIETSEDGYHICLDHRKVKTPAGAPLAIPLNRPSFAHLAVLEWHSQEKALKPHSLPLTSLAARAQDGMQTEDNRHQAMKELLKYLNTDSLCCQLPHPEKLVRLQDQHYTPILDWVKKEYGLILNVSKDILSNNQPDNVKTGLRDLVLEFDPLELAAFERACISTKSYLIALALLKKQISVEEAAQAAHVEINFQIEQWGMVEDTHDLDYHLLRTMLASSAMATTKD